MGVTHIASAGEVQKAGEAPSCGGWGREGARSEVRAEQRLAPGGPQAPITRKPICRAVLRPTRKSLRRLRLVRSALRPKQKWWLRRLLLLPGRGERTRLVPLPRESR